MTSAPTVATVFDDSLEFQVVLPTAGIAHPSGYPLYTLGGFVASKLIPFRDPAGRVNLISALAAAATVAVFYLVARRLAGSRTAAIISSIALAVSPVWFAGDHRGGVCAARPASSRVLLFLLKWEEAVMLGRANDRYLVTSGLIFGLGLAHHRMIALLLPATLVFVFWTDPGLLRAPRRWIKPAIAAIVPLLLYLYLPIRGQTTTSLDGTYVATWRGTLDWVLARL
jgi:4-amino-4-deoxy-L-arabinose transferase-like glycosyltransferase